MKQLNLIAISACLTGLFLGCSETHPCASDSSGANVESVEPVMSAAYVGIGDPYERGELLVRVIEVHPCEADAPTALRIHAPEAAGDYPVVLFQHGFMSRNSAYGDIVEHLSSHGFVVVAPQMYEPGIGPLLGNPSASQEAERAALVVNWLPERLDSIIGFHARADLLGIAGHSRGGKVSWLLASSNPGRFLAIAGVDPVDGTGGPAANQPRVINGAFPFSIPTLVLGTELGGQCAPAGDNHVQFFEASASPAWHVIALNQGHGDMLDEPAAAAAAATFCDSGANREGMRRLTAGLLVALFRAELQAEDSSLAVLEGVIPPPIDATFQKK